MKRLNAIIQLCIVVFFVVAVSSCKKSEDTTNTYTAENELALTNAWKAKMKTDKVAYDSTASKIYYIVDTTKVGSGPKVTSGDTVTVKYSGAFMDGSIFDSSDNFTYVHKATGQRLIPGWEEGIELLNKGSRATFLFPSSLAYGTSGYYIIPPYSPLIFVIEVVDIK
jgi:FKBP-type peptidyl-prolyl cis-trans isomerase FkpA